VDVNTNENTVRITTKPLAQLDDNDNIRTILKQDTNKQPIIIVDGNPTDSSFKIEEIPTNEIESITVLKGVAAEKNLVQKLNMVLWKLLPKMQQLPIINMKKT
jgi:hypothetical protein